MDDFTQKVVLAIAGGLLGFGLKWFLAERQAIHELRRETDPGRAEAYKKLWALCRPDFGQRGAVAKNEQPEAVLSPILKYENRKERHQSLRDWYEDGGGLFLWLNATGRYWGAMKLLGKESDLSDAEATELKGHLSWLRTELKNQVGSYTKRDRNTQI